MIETDSLQAYNGDERSVALQSNFIIDSSDDDDYQDIAAMASAICQTPVSLIIFIDEKRQSSKPDISTAFEKNVRNMSFSAPAIADDLMIMPNAFLSSKLANYPRFTEGQFTFYAGVPLINVDGSLLGTLCIFGRETQDLRPEQVRALKALAKQVVAKLELRRKVAELEQLNQELVNANVLIQKFASMVAHDIKNPLSSIKLASQALKSKIEIRNNDGCLKLVDSNIIATDNLLFLVEEMLAYSKNPELLLERKQDFGLNALITKVLSMLTIPDNMVIKMPPRKSKLHFSLIAIEQILINLISNAIRYNDKKEGCIKIHFVEDADFYHLEVEDNGRGIPEQYLDKIFSANYTLKIADRYNHMGSGIGLATVSDLLRILKSSISVKSELKKGSTFSVKLRK